jgi:hypothetical protein
MNMKKEENKEKEFDYKKDMSEEDQKLLKESVDAVDKWYTYSNEHLQRARDFLTFLYVEQWDIPVKQARKAAGKPCMQFNKLTTAIRSNLGEARENSPDLTVRGVGKNVTQDQVDIRDGLVRQISYKSDSDIIYQIALKNMMECGWGAVRNNNRYVSPDSFEQEIYQEAIEDIQTVFWDPTSRMLDKSDGDGCGVYTTFSKERFDKEWPGIPNPQSVDFSYNYFFNWYTNDTITICERYYKEYYTKTKVQLSDGNVLDKEEAEEILKKQEELLLSDPNIISMMGYEPLSIVNEKSVKDYKIKYVKFIKDRILEKKDDTPFDILPIPYFVGDYVIIDGERIPIPYVQDGIDNQKLANLLGSELAYAVIRSRKETAIGTPSNFKGFEDEWRNSDNVKGFLRANPDRETKMMPQFVTPPVFNRDILDLFNNNNQDLKDNLGWFDEAMGQATNAVSGLAISRRQQASKKPVNVYMDNLARGIRQCGKIILDMIPRIYDTERTITVIRKDKSNKSVDINKRNGYAMDEDGEIQDRIENNMSDGEYDIQVQVQGSYDAQLAQALDMLTRLAQADPRIGSLIPDLLAENSGLKNTQQLVNRLKTLLPPEILAEEEGKPLPPPQTPPPYPQIELEREKIQLGYKEDETKNKQLAIDEQKLMLEAELANVDKEVTFTKAMAEIRKSSDSKDIALINHTTKMNDNHQKTLQQRSKGAL